MPVVTFIERSFTDVDIKGGADDCEVRIFDDNRFGLGVAYLGNPLTMNESTRAR